MTTVSPSDESTMQTVAGLMQAGRLIDARAIVTKALNTGLNSDRLLATAGMLAWRTGDAAGAIDPLRELIERQPGDQATRLNLAAALTETGAVAEVENLLAPLAGEPRADRLRAYAAQLSGQFEHAITIYHELLAKWPDDPDSWANLGNVYAAGDDVEQAINAFERAITLRPADSRFYLNLAGVLERADRRTARRRVMRDAVEQAPSDPVVLLALGLAEAAEGNFADAEAALRRAIALAPNEPGPYLELGLLLENRNQVAALEELAAEARAHLGAEATLLSGWAAFRARKFEEAAELARAVPETINPVRRLHLLAQAADRGGNADEAFQWLEQMNVASQAAALPRPPGRTYREQVVAAAAAFSLAPLPPAQPATEIDPPIFVTGFPRSGTTLLDTMLSAAPGTYVLEERPLLTAIERRVGPMAGVTPLPMAEIEALREYYFETLATLEPSFTGARLIDKHPLHSARIPLIAQLFPDAPIVFVERHPYDVVLSCLMANFQLNHAMRSFTNLTEAALTYDAVLTAWSLAEERLPLNVHRVRYERLVEDAAGELSQLFKFVGIDANPAALDHRTAAAERGPIRTASYAQVTEPIYNRAVARWRRYERQLAPVMPILAPWAERMGYETA